MAMIDPRGSEQKSNCSLDPNHPYDVQLRRKWFRLLQTYLRLDPADSVLGCRLHCMCSANKSRVCFAGPVESAFFGLPVCVELHPSQSRDGGAHAGAPGSPCRSQRGQGEIHKRALMLLALSASVAPPLALLFQHSLVVTL